MATLIIDKSRKTPGYLIQWREGFRRPSIYLGGLRYTRKTAEELKTIVETLRAYQWNGTTVFDKRTTIWLETAHPDILSKLASVGLYRARERITCKLLWDTYIDKNRKGWQPSTLEGNQNVGKHFFKEFSHAELIEHISPERLLEWKESLSSNHAPSSVKTYMIITKSVFDLAIKKNWLAKNPMEDVPIISAGMCANRENFRTITKAESANILAICPDQEWRVIFASARWLGLRCPSEVLLMRWNDIAWDREGILIHSKKTQRFAGHQGRFMPLFKEARVELEKLCLMTEHAEDDFVIQKYRCKNDKYFAYYFKKLCRKAGLGKVTEPFRNTRRTCSNEIRQEHGSKNENAWLGHSNEVMKRHYQNFETDNFSDIVNK